MTAMTEAPLSALLAGRTPVEAHKPWPRYEVDPATWDAVGRALAHEGPLLALWGEAEAVHLAFAAPAPALVTLRVSAGRFPSIGRYHPPAIRLERAICDLYGFVADGAADARPWLDHGAWGLRAPLALHLALVLVAGLWLPGEVVGWFRAVAALLG